MDKPGQFSIEYMSLSKYNELLATGKEDIWPEDYFVTLDAGDDYDDAVKLAQSRVLDSMSGATILRFNNIHWNEQAHEWDFDTLDRITDVHPNGSVERLDY